ncbi:conserved protein of unknown function [Hyphomicrobium sp. 1Nfss2.1]|uniref:YcgN family cysteine cluster protein n=1 Tax=Hyphomicrobium sp. 1Nfss2.1 TaxID=3413936 RepID=UPI003C7C0C6D
MSKSTTSQARKQQDAPGYRPFWETKSLHAMSHAEWESLCDGCGRCCLLKVEDEDTGDVYLTRLGCKLLDTNSCRCRDYPNRKKKVHDCLSLTPGDIEKMPWLPATCAYRTLHEGRSLEWWHPLVSGDPETVHEAGISVRGWSRSEKGVKPDAIVRYIIGEAG